LFPFCLLQIEMGFLMVGHTHEDIDQSFSCLSRHLQKNDALTSEGEGEGEGEAELHVMQVQYST